MSRILTTAPVTAAKELFAAVRPYAAVADLTAADWAEIAGDCQAGIRALEATQTLALARVAATDDVVHEDGTVTEEFVGLGHQRLDAPALVSEQLAQTDTGAARRVAAAVDLLTRMPRLVEAMGAGDLDLYRATRIAEELTECSPEICDEVLDRIKPQHLAGDPVGPLVRRVRRALAAVNSDLLKKRRIRALSDTGLTRSVDADGVDTWIARMPLEQSAQLWDAIDERAQTLRTEAAQAARTEDPTTSTGHTDDTEDPDEAMAAASRPRRMSIHAARLAALIEILMGNITGTFHLHLGIPMSQFGQDPNQPANEDGGPSTDSTGDADPTTDPSTDDDAPESTEDVDASDDLDPGGDTPATVRPQDLGRADHPDLSDEANAAPPAGTSDGPDPASAPAAPDQSPARPRSTGACFGLAFPDAQGDRASRDHPSGDPDDLIPVTGFGTAGTVHLRRAFLEHLLQAARSGTAPHQHDPGQTPARFTVSRDVIGCDDDTGAYLTGTTDLRHWLDLIDPTAEPPPGPPRTEAYRPTAALRRLLTARDGRCRFPRCQAAARFADVDHVTAWPAGATDLAGLALLCRRHHRIKQRHRWHVRIRPDATLEWTTPTGQVRITHPIDHLEPARPPRAREHGGEDEQAPTRTSPFGDPILPPTPPAQLVPELPPRPRPSTGHHPDGDFGWLGAFLARNRTDPRRRDLHPVSIRYDELERCTARRREAESTADAERLAAQRAARDAEPPPF